MKNKEIQEKRMREYFIRATKEILKGEGIQSISVRNIADRAGYSYATLYSYFRDVNDLIFLCVADFQEECRLFVAEQTENKKGLSKLKDSVLAYISYFVEYPGIFELFYQIKAGTFGHKKTTIDIIGSSLDMVCEEAWSYFMQHNIISGGEAKKIKTQLRLIVIGMLVLYLNRGTPQSYAEFMSDANIQVDFSLYPLSKM